MSTQVQQASERPRPGAEPTPPAPPSQARRLRPGAPAAHAPVPHGHGPGCPSGKCSQKGLVRTLLRSERNRSEAHRPARPPRSSTLEGTAVPQSAPATRVLCPPRRWAPPQRHTDLCLHTHRLRCACTPPTRILTHTHNFTHTCTLAHTLTQLHTPLQRTHNVPRVHPHTRQHTPVHTRVPSHMCTHGVTHHDARTLSHTCSYTHTLRHTLAEQCSAPPLGGRPGAFLTSLRPFSALCLQCLSWVHFTFSNLCWRNVFDIWECLLSKFQVGMSVAKHSVSWTRATVRGQGRVCSPNPDAKQREARHGPSPRAPPRAVPESAPGAGPGAPTLPRLPAECEAPTPTALPSSAWLWTTRSALSGPWPEGPAPHPASNVLRGPESSAALADPTSTPLLGIPAARAVFRGRRHPSSEGAGRTASRGPASRCAQKGGDSTTGLSLSRSLQIM